MKTVGYEGSMGLYVLRGREPVKIDDPMVWALEGGNGRRNHTWRVALDQVGEYEVSTVFLGIDMSHGWGGPPILFETMVFGPDGYQSDCFRCSTYDEAERQHENMVAEVRSRGVRTK
jgi:hypothetical protein